MEKLNLNAFADEASSMIDGQIKACQRNGLNGIEIRDVDGVNVTKISDSKAKSVKKKLDDAGLKVWSMGSPIGKINIVTDNWAEHLELLQRTIEIAHILDTKYIRMFSFYYPEGDKPEQYRDEVLERLNKMADIAEAEDMILCHENEKGIYGDVASRCLDILTNVPRIRGVFDPANFVQSGQNTLEAWDMLKDHIFYMHVKDAFSDMRVVPAGCGEGHVPEIIADYLKRGGTEFTVEPHLKVFGSLKGLEKEGAKSMIGGVYQYKTNDEAFDAACAALRGILAKCGYGEN
ncbi:MAG: sugar phosphate isomerase/epimerase family protein [Lachnospiraceae bacterium]|jgi:sugar phosphate isomerase/epimerase